MLSVTNSIQDTIHDWSYDLVTTVRANSCSREQLFSRTGRAIWILPETQHRSHKVGRDLEIIKNNFIFCFDQHYMLQWS